MAVPGVEWNDIKDAPLLHLILETRESNDFVTEGTDEPSQFIARTVRGTAPPRKRKRKAPVESVPTTLTPTVQAIVHPYFNHEFAVVGKRPSFLSEEKLARGQPHIDVAGGNTKYKVCLLD